MNNDNPKVTVALMTCNRENLLKNAIENVFRQSFQDLELICILGMSSTDQSEEMLTELRAKNMIRFSKNFGSRIDARNLAFEAAKGEYLCFLDDDDAMLNNRIQKQVEYLDAHPEVDIVSCSTMLNNQAGLMHTFKKLDLLEIRNLIKEGVDIDEVVNFQSCMFRMDSIKRAFATEKIFDDLFIAGGEGQFFLYECLFNKGMVIHNIPETIYIYYVGQARNSLTNRTEPVFYNEHLYGKPYEDKIKFITTFREIFNVSNDKDTSEPEVEIIDVVKTPVPEEKSTEKPTRKPRIRKKKDESKPVEEIVTEKPKRGRKKKVETEAPTEAPKRRGRPKKVKTEEV